MCLNGQLHKIEIYVALFVRKEIKAREISGIEDVLLYYCCKLISGRCVNTYGNKLLFYVVTLLSLELLLKSSSGQ